MSALDRARRWASGARRTLRRALARRPPRRPGGGSAADAHGEPRHRRYLSDSAERMEMYIQAAQQYVAQLSAEDRRWLFRKPYDYSTGHPAFFDEMYPLMNLLRAMGITPRGRVLEVGSGPGWVTEILVALGYEVDALEPSADMIAVARERLDHAREHHRLAAPLRVEFHAEALETCTLPDDRYDAVLFHAALHHIVDERRGLEQCYRLLRPGGVLGVSEGAWIPGDAYWEAKLDEAMRLYGALENPFTAEYLDFLLERCGFVDIRRYYAVNGLFPADMGDRRLSEIASHNPRNGNHLTARKPSPYAATTRDPSAHTEARIEILESSLDRATGLATLRARLHNRGETAWLPATDGIGWVSISLRKGEPGSPDLVEGASRHALPRLVAPGDTLTLDLTFHLHPEEFDGPWLLDLVDEGVFWFSARGTPPAPVRF
jgi:SAM-dependent methyltransferase